MFPLVQVEFSMANKHCPYIISNNRSKECTYMKDFVVEKKQGTINANQWEKGEEREAKI